jgi:5-(aminomethyl)-3-furanmethanol phosphate kinase
MTCDNRNIAREIYAGPGFDAFGVGVVVKLGGSLLADIKSAVALVNQLTDMAKDQPMLIFPGGGPFDNLVESMARETNIPSNLVNPACMRALDQTGILLAANAVGTEAVEDLAGVRTALTAGNVPVLLPSKLILSLDVFTRFDVITSDTLGAFFAFLAGAELYVVLTNVDGVFLRDPAGNDGAPLPRLSTSELAGMGHTSVDRCLGMFLDAVGMKACVLNGHNVDGIKSALKGDQTHGTWITP